MLARFLVLGVLALAPLSGCFEFRGGTSAEASGDAIPNPDPSGPDLGGGAFNGCQIASDCVLAASTCCECPSFAVPASEDTGGGCEEVDCDASGFCPAVEATCDEGQCALICSPLLADKICAFGFAADAAGCLINECAGEPTSALVECEIDADCVQVPADCCGCGLGGLDKAMPTSQADENADNLNCPVDPACPGINVCNADEFAQCISGSCMLAPAPDDLNPPANEPGVQCGTPNLPPCATEFSCVLNAISANNASALGVGTCVML